MWLKSLKISSEVAQFLMLLQAFISFEPTALLQNKLLYRYFSRVLTTSANIIFFTCHRFKSLTMHLSSTAGAYPEPNEHLKWS